MKIALLSDSTADLPADLAEELGVTLVPLWVTFQGVTHADWSDLSVPEMLAQVQGGAALPKTSQPTPADFAAAFERLLQTADHVLAVHISATLSGTAGASALAARDFPGKVTVLDSGSATGGLALIVEHAARMIQQGASLAAVTAALERLRHVVSIRFSVATLDFLRKNGRIGAAQALLGSLLNVKPLLEFRDGVLHPLGRPRGAGRALQETLDGVRAYLNQHGPSRAWFIYTQAREDVEPLRQACLNLGVREVRTHQAG
ncbi:MAG TPA: DegV family protein, partial [Deinococcales bacterium]|nr:DegV family protein [Deinococcales bacterium]